MTTTRESVYAALFTRLQTVPAIKTFGRRLKHWADCAGQTMPCLYLAMGGEQITQQRGMPRRLTMTASVYIYVTINDKTVAPSTALNGLLDALEAALAPSPATGVQTLGGVVSHCWISGRTETDEGTLGDLAVAIVPLEILVP